MGRPCTEVNLELDWCSEDYGYNPGSHTYRGDPFGNWVTPLLHSELRDPCLIQHHSPEPSQNQVKQGHKRMVYYRFTNTERIFQTEL